MCYRTFDTLLQQKFDTWLFFFSRERLLIIDDFVYTYEETSFSTFADMNNPHIQCPSVLTFPMVSFQNIKELGLWECRKGIGQKETGKAE